MGKVPLVVGPVVVVDIREEPRRNDWLLRALVPIDPSQDVLRCGIPQTHLYIFFRVGDSYFIYWTKISIVIWNMNKTTVNYWKLYYYFFKYFDTHFLYVVQFTFSNITNNSISQYFEQKLLLIRWWPGIQVRPDHKKINPNCENPLHAIFLWPGPDALPAFLGRNSIQAS